MESNEFREFSKAITDYIINYHENIRTRDVYPSVETGYLYSKIPKEAPNHPDKWQNIMEDLERLIMPGITHWQSPRFHAFFPTGMSYPSIVGEMLSAGLGVIGFNWITSPACTELEIIVMDWLGKIFNLPSHFLNQSDGPGGGIIQGSASEATLIGLLAAKEKTVHRIKMQDPEADENFIKSMLIAYTSDQSNSSVEKAGILGSMRMRLLPTDKKGRLRGYTLKATMEKDIKNGLIPCYIVATLGTTGTCSFDCLEEIGPICKQQSVWLHVDAAYAGGSFVCPEYQHLMAGIEYADSIVINVHKWLLVNFDCSAMWLKNCNDLENAFSVNRIYLEDRTNNVVPELRNWQLPLGRRFRALKLWFTLRLYGLKGLQDHIRNHVKMAKYFEQLVKEDTRFEIITPAIMGLVCFRLKGENSLNRELLDKIILSRQLFLVPATLNGVMLVLRFAVTSAQTNKKDIEYSWDLIKTLASTITLEKEFIVKSTKNENDISNITDLCSREKIQQECLKYTQG